jgi:hypothetical protein
MEPMSVLYSYFLFWTVYYFILLLLFIIYVTPQNKLNGLGVLNPVTYARRDVRTEG